MTVGLILAVATLLFSREPAIPNCPLSMNPQKWCQDKKKPTKSVLVVSSIGPVSLLIEGITHRYRSGAILRYLVLSLGRRSWQLASKTVGEESARHWIGRNQSSSSFNYHDWTITTVEQNFNRKWQKKWKIVNEWRSRRRRRWAATTN